MGGCGIFGSAEAEDEARGYSIGEEERLRFYFQHAFRGTIPASVGIALFEEEKHNRGDVGIGRGARRVLTVRDVDDPERILPELHFESGDPEIFEIEDAGCTPDERCDAASCPIDEERFECDSARVYRVRLGLFREGVGRLIVRDSDGDLFDTVRVVIFRLADDLD